MIRVFPRKTKFTPDDDLAFIGDPPLFRPPDQPVRISCSFTWDINEAERLKRSWSRFYSDVQVGGPAYGDPGDLFVPGRFLKKGIIMTSRGCSKNCDWCLVPSREGWIRELPIKDGWIINDNNLLACSKNHILKVFEMFKDQPKPIKILGGLDAELFRPWHVDLLKQIRLRHVWFACDYQGAIEHLEKISDLMADFPPYKKKCYALIGYKGDTVRSAEKRLKRIYKLGFFTYASLYRDEFSLFRNSYSNDWLKLERDWKRPAIFKKIMKGEKWQDLRELRQSQSI